MSQFSKKTGDYPALSSTDIKVIALTYKLERLKVGKDHLNSVPPAPKQIKVVDHSVINDKSIVGFYMPDGEDDQVCSSLRFCFIHNFEIVTFCVVHFLQRVLNRAANSFQLVFPGG